MYSTIPKMLCEKAKTIPNLTAQFYKDSAKTFQPVTYIELFQDVLYFAAGLVYLGTKRGEHVGLISDNRPEWFVSSLGIMTCGCADIPRGSEATVKDLSYILSFAECKTVIVENVFGFKKLLECLSSLPLLENLILIDDKNTDKTIPEKNGIKVFTYSDILDFGKKYRYENPGEIEKILEKGDSEDTATIIFTSGTTGTPKGVELCHRNFLCQVKDIALLLPLKRGDKSLSILPVWHVYEREIEYYLMYIGAAICYSKPVASVILDDMKKISPEFMACVPRLWEAILSQIKKQCAGSSKNSLLHFKLSTGAAVLCHKITNFIHSRNQQFKKRNFFVSVFSKILYVPLVFLLPVRAWGNKFYAKTKQVLGGKFILGLSGGGGLAPSIDRFYNAMGITLIEGYGLTETAPICCLRSPKKPVLGTIGKIMPYCEGKVVSMNGKDCRCGEKGILYIKGQNVMKGYYRQPELTSQFVKDGWFNTGDLVIQTIKGEIIVKGRAKDTIVLRSGENVEPFPIECKLAESPYIAQAVVVGNDRNCLGALIIPSKEKISAFAEENGLKSENFPNLLKNHVIRNLIFKELERLITPKNGFKHFERIGKFIFLEKPFEVGVELSAKQDIVRYKINEIYEKQINQMFSEPNGAFNFFSENILNKKKKKELKNAMIVS